MHDFVGCAPSHCHEPRRNCLDLHGNCLCRLIVKHCVQFEYKPTINQPDDAIVECTADAYADTWLGSWNDQAKISAHPPLPIRGALW